MKRVLAIVFLAIILLGVWWLFFKTDKPEPIFESETTQLTVKKHSDEFNQRITAALDSYFAMSAAFVDADTASAKLHAQEFIKAVDNIPTAELEKDDAQVMAAARQQIEDMKSNASPIIQDSDITEMRQDFRMVSENLYPFLRTIGYEGEKVYWQNCPMAFGDNEANWLSSTRKVINPYLGKNHPEYKGTMLNCGEVKDSIYLR